MYQFHCRHILLRKIPNKFIFLPLFHASLIWPHWLLLPQQMALVSRTQERATAREYPVALYTQDTVPTSPKATDNSSPRFSHVSYSRLHWSLWKALSCGVSCDVSCDVSFTFYNMSCDWHPRQSPTYNAHYMVRGVLC